MGALLRPAVQQQSVHACLRVCVRPPLMKQLYLFTLENRAATGRLLSYRHLRGRVSMRVCMRPVAGASNVAAAVLALSTTADSHRHHTRPAPCHAHTRARRRVLTSSATSWRRTAAHQSSPQRRSRRWGFGAGARLRGDVVAATRPCARVHVCVQERIGYACRTLPHTHTHAMCRHHTQAAAAVAAAEAAAADAAAGPADPTKFVGKKSKAVAKKGTGATQWEILAKSGIPESEIPLFRCGCDCVCACVRACVCTLGCALGSCGGLCACGEAGASTALTRPCACPDTHTPPCSCTHARHATRRRRAGTLRTGCTTSRRWQSATCARWAAASTGAARSSRPT
jgi:hypothetical protein